MASPFLVTGTLGMVRLIICVPYFPHSLPVDTLTQF